MCEVCRSDTGYPFYDMERVEYPCDVATALDELDALRAAVCPPKPESSTRRSDSAILAKATPEGGAE
jgi:hypothetical protein